MGAWKSNSLLSPRCQEHQQLFHKLHKTGPLKRGILVWLKQNGDVCSALTTISSLLIWSFSPDPRIEPCLSSVGVMLHLLLALLSASKMVPSQIKLRLSFAYDGEARLRRESVFDLCFWAAGGLENGLQLHCSLAKLQIASAHLELGFCAKNRHLSAAVCAQFVDIFKNNCYFCLQMGLAGSQIEMLLFLHYGSNYQRIKVAQLAASHQLHIGYIDMTFHYFIWSFLCNSKTLKSRFRKELFSIQRFTLLQMTSLLDYRNKKLRRN